MTFMVWKSKTFSSFTFACSHKPISICLIEGPTPKLTVNNSFKKGVYVV